MLTFVLCVPCHSKSIGSKACLNLKQQDFIHCSLFSLKDVSKILSVNNLIGAHLGIVEVNDCAIILDHVHLLNAGNIVH